MYNFSKDQAWFFDAPKKRIIHLENLVQQKVFYRLNKLSKQLGKTIAPAGQHTVQVAFYELGHQINKTAGFKPKANEALFFHLDFSKRTDYQWKHTTKKTRVSTFRPRVSEQEYGRLYKQGRGHLLNGDCYQFNLTCPFEFDAQLDCEQMLQVFLENPTKVGAYAHLIHLPSIGRTFYSNSPECLFQMRFLHERARVWSMPIKGTKQLSSDIKADWEELVSDQKNQAELDMITDLVRNDLAKIGTVPQEQLIKRKSPLKVPGLLHQYSLVARDLDLKTTWKDIWWSLFPGGSVTGAPKKRSMEIIESLEGRARGFYCGSTFLNSGSITAASINIRSGELVDGRNTLYQAGGGITLASNAKEEYQEMVSKVTSFGQLLM